MWRLLRTILFFLTFTMAFSQDPETFFTTGEAQLSSGDLAGAESSFNAALKADPSFAPAYQGLSKLYLHKGDLKKANEYSIQAVQADEDEGHNEPASLNGQYAPDIDVLARPIHGEADEDTVHGRRGPDHWSTERKKKGEGRAAETAQEIEPQEVPGPEPRLESRAEEEQPDHVEENVAEARVQEHVSEDGPRPEGHGRNVDAVDPDNGGGKQRQKPIEQRARLHHQKHHHVRHQQPRYPRGHSVDRISCLVGGACLRPFSFGVHRSLGEI